MQAYRYLARSFDGRRVEGSITASATLAVADHLRARGLIAVDIAPEPHRLVRWLRDGRIGGRRASLRLFFRSLSVLIDAGLTLRRSLEIVGEQLDDPLMREVLAALRGAVDAGTSLAAAMEMHPTIFTPLVIALIRAAEQSAQLSETLERYAATLEHEHSLSRKIVSALTYPAFVLSCALVLLTTLVVTIIPTLASLFIQMNVEMPSFLTVGLRIGDFFHAHGAFVLVSLAAIVVLTTVWCRRTVTAIDIDRLRLRMPLFGRLLRRAIVARFARLLASLLQAGIGIVDALDATIPALGSPVYMREVSRIAQSLQDGGTIAAGLGANPWFESIAVHLVAIGEETGRLDENLARLADVYERDVSEDLAALVALIEPMTIVVVGIVVGAVVLAIFVPLYSLIGGVK